MLAITVAFCSFQSWSQSDCGELLDHDQDGIIGAEDLMNLLSFYGQPLEEDAGPCDNLESVTFDGYEYDLVEIGDQCWFAENLRTEHYANGDAIPANLTDSEWGSTTGGAVAGTVRTQDASTIPPMAMRVIPIGRSTNTVACTIGMQWTMSEGCVLRVGTCLRMGSG